MYLFIINVFIESPLKWLLGDRDGHAVYYLMYSHESQHIKELHTSLILMFINKRKEKMHNNDKRYVSYLLNFYV